MQRPGWIGALPQVVSAALSVRPGPRRSRRKMVKEGGLGGGKGAPARVRADAVEIWPALAGYRIEQRSWRRGGATLPRPRPDGGKAGRLSPARPAPPRPERDPPGHPAAPAGALRTPPPLRHSRGPSPPACACAPADGRAFFKFGDARHEPRALRTASRAPEGPQGGRTLRAGRRPTRPQPRFCARRSAAQRAPIQRDAPAGPRGGPISPRLGRRCRRAASCPAPPQRPEHAPCGIRALACLAKDLGPAKPLYAPKVRRHAWADGKCAGRPGMQTPSRTTNERRKRAGCRWST